MGTVTKSNKNREEANAEMHQVPRTVKADFVIIGLVLAIIGSIIGSSYAKDTLTNYAGFGMLMAGIVALVLGVCGIAIRSVYSRLSREVPVIFEVNRPKMLFISIWSIGVGLFLAVDGSILGGAFVKDSIINFVGFGILLAGISVLVLGIFGTALGALKIEEARSGIKFERPRVVFFEVLLMGFGLIFTVIGSILTGCFAKESILNYSGFFMLIFGITALGVGLSGTVVAALNYRLDLVVRRLGECKPRILFGSIWAIGIGSMLIINGSLIAGSYEKNSLLNYAGFGMLLSGTGVFVYGLFETARFSATGYLNSKLAQKSKRGLKCDPKKKGTFIERAKNVRANLLKTSAILNLSGMMAAAVLLLFSLWQLDLIVSGPVWWESSSSGSGWSWPGPGAYSKDYFQCFLWKTTVGQAYDVFFMLIFISFIVMFASAYFWPRGRLTESNITLKPNGRDKSASPKRKRRKEKKPVD